MNGRTRIPFAALLGVVVLSFAACGGGSSNEDDIKSVVKDIDDNPASLCTDHASKAFLAKVGGEAACKTGAVAAAKEDPSKSKVSDVSVDGDKATATITDATGPAKVSFVKEDGDWKVDDSVDQ
jgi:hypothetical protein